MDSQGLAHIEQSRRWSLIVLTVKKWLKDKKNGSKYDVKLKFMYSRCEDALECTVKRKYVEYCKVVRKARTRCGGSGRKWKCLFPLCYLHGRLSTFYRQILDQLKSLPFTISRFDRGKRRKEKWQRQIPKYWYITM